MNLQSTLTGLLLKDIEIEKLGIKGKLVNLLYSYENNGFGIEMTIHTDEKNRHVKLPLPFKVELHEDNLIYFDYRLTSIFNHRRWKAVVKEIMSKSETLNTNNKFFNSIIEIVIS